MNPNSLTLTGVVQSEIDQPPSGTMINIRLTPVGEHEQTTHWAMTLNVSEALAEHPLLTRKKKLVVTITEG